MESYFNCIQLKKWIKNNTNEYLLFDSNGGKLTRVKLNQRLEINSKKREMLLLKISHISNQ